MHSNSTKQATTAEEKERLLKHDKLEKEDQDTLNDVIAILEPFYKLTKRAEGTTITGDRGILSNYITTLNSLLAHIREARDNINLRLSNDNLVIKGLQYLKVYIVNYQTKLDTYFMLVDKTPAYYATIVTNPVIKWKYFEHTQKDAITQKDATNPETWLPSGQAALSNIWKDYKDLPVDDDILTSKSKRACSPDRHEQSFNIALLYGDEDNSNKLETFLSSKPHYLPTSETLG